MIMNISSVSLDSMLASQAANLKNGNVMTEISFAVMKQSQDAQEVFNNALLEMIQQGPRPDGTGSILNLSA
jgi:hypothetical protein